MNISDALRPQRDRTRGTRARPWPAVLAALLLALWLPAAQAAIQVQVSGPGGGASQSLPDSGGAFDLSIPLNRNAVNNLKVIATDDSGNRAEQTLAITQVSLDSVVVSRIKSERLTVQRVEQLVADGVIDLVDPANYNVSVFDIVLTIAQKPVAISLPIAIAKGEAPEGFESVQIPSGRGDGGSPPNIQDVEIIVFETALPGPPGQPDISIPGVIVIEGRIKSLKEFYSVRLLLMNTSGIFTLTDVTAEIAFPDGGLTAILPQDGIASFGDISPGTADEPGQKEKEFIVRGDEIGVRDVRVAFAGVLTGPGIPVDAPIPFGGSALTDVEVKGPPTFEVQVHHPDSVTAGVPYELEVQIANTDEIPALYASLGLDVGFDGRLVSCAIDGAGDPQCTDIEGEDIRNLGHILPGETVTQLFTIIPTKSGAISSCMGVADQNISLRVLVGTIGCLIGEFPPGWVPSDGTPAVSVLPSPNAVGIHTDSPVVAFFSERILDSGIVTGEGGSFNVFDSADRLLPGQLRIETLNDKTVAVWQRTENAGRLAPNQSYTVVVTTDIADLDGDRMQQEWSSGFTTTGTGASDLTPPELTLSVHPSVDPNQVLPGQVVRLNAYASDQGSGIARVEARIKDRNAALPVYVLFDQKTFYQGDLPPYLFAIDSANLVPGHVYELLVSAYDGNGNVRDATLSLVLAASAAPPTLVLPADPTEAVLHGISVTLTPVSVSGGVRRVSWYLDTAAGPAAQPFSTLSLAPYQATLPTLGLVTGGYSIRAVALDGLGQTGEDSWAFVLADNPNEPVVSFGAAADGGQFPAGTEFSVRPEVTDPVGLASLLVYVDDPGAPQPLTLTGQAVRVDTAALALGPHRLYVHATNRLGIANDLADPGSWLGFEVVQPPAGQPPAAPTGVSVSPQAGGQALVIGTSVPGAWVELTNLTTGLSLGLGADATGAFGGTIEAQAGDRIRVLAYDYGQSPNPSPATEATVPAAPVLQSIELAPAVLNFTQAGAYADLTVTGHYDTGGTADLTSIAAFASSNPGVATVSPGGRVAAVGSGSAAIAATVAGLQAQTQVQANIVVLTGLEASPSPLALTYLGETVQLQVMAHYSDGSSQNRTGSAAFSSAASGIAAVSSAGLVSAVANGATQVYVSLPGLAPIAVQVSVDSGQDNPPTVAIQSPASGGSVERGQTLNLTVRATDAEGGVASVTLTATGATAYSETRQIVPAAQDRTLSFGFAVSHTAPVGGTIHIEVEALDTSGKAATPAAIDLTVVDTTAPVASILEPAQQAAFNYGDTVTLRVAATDAVGVTRIRYQTGGALSLSGSQSFGGTSPAEALFQLVIPYGVPDPDLRILAYAQDASGNEGVSAPLDLILTGADITPPATQATAVSDPGTGAVATVAYQVTSGLADLDHVELYFRRNGIGTFNRYTGADGTGSGQYLPQGGANGTIAFDSTRMGGDGAYEFATVGVDLAGNREPLPQSAGANTGDPGAVATFATGAPVTLIASNLEIADATYDGRNLRIVGATVTLLGARSFGNVELLNGAVLTQRATTATEAFGLQAQVWTLSLDLTSRIDVTGRGYLGGNKTGLGDTAHTVGFAAGSQAGNGGSYGGLAGHYAASGANQPNPVYGNLANPVDLGSGGGAWGGPGGDGGGRVLFSAINLAVDGAIRADGGLSGGTASGEGSGGSINLSARTISGKGAIAANGGGTGGSNHTGGGGGRIAIRSLDLSTLNLAGIGAAGGVGYYGAGADGTVYLLGEGQTGGELVVNGQGANSPFTDLLIPPGQTFDAITLQNGARVIVQQPIQIADTLLLRGNSLLTHPTASEAGLRIEAARVVVEAGSTIDASGRGYLGGDRSGLGQTAHTLGLAAGAQAGSGGSHGGLGGRYGASSGPTTPVYGDPARPDRLGGGGGAWGGDGGNGGGYVRILASEEVVVDGAIRADGGLSSGTASGEGAGGSVWIGTSRLAGTGSISANGGGTGGSNHTGGGGGRVAVYADYVDGSDDLWGLRSISAWRGRGYYDNTQGSAGTVYLHIGGFEGLVVDDNEASGTAATGTPLSLMGPGVTAAVTADTLTTDGVLPLLPNALVGLRINPDLGHDESFDILANTEDTITVATPNGHGVAFASVAAGGRTYAGDYRFQNLTFRRGGHLEVGDRLTVTDTLRIAEYGLLTHPPTTATYAATLDLEVGTLDIDSTGRIDVTGCGYLGGDRSGLASGVAHTSGFMPGAQAGNGGSHGGAGGHYASAGGAVTNPLYGDLTDPADLGSGGGAWGGPGADGGGRIFIVASSILNDGAIRADGGVSTGTASGEGSGGTVNIRTGTLTGTGLIGANGGTTAGGNHVGGGGGRIAIRYGGTLGLPEGNVQSRGGDGYYGDGGHGTVYLKGPGQTYGDLTIDGLGMAQPTDTVTIPGGLTFDNITLRSGARVVADAGLHVLGTLTLGANATLTHSPGLEAGLQIEAARVVVASGSAIDVSGRGYLGGDKSGLPGGTAHTLGLAAGAQAGNGGSHGGLGAHYSGAGGATTNPVYGDPARPDRLGSGGGAWSGAGGDGGGHVHIVASDELVVEGAIRADGAISSGSASGEGAGGSVWIETSRLAGTGSISANGGGTSGGNHTGGGGGRVAIYADTLDAADDLDGLRAIGAWRGRGYYDNPPGSAGTLYLKIGGVEELIVDDNETSVTAATGTPLSLMGPGLTTATTADTLTTDGVLPLLPNALVGLRINPDAAQDESFEILANTEDSIAVATPNEHGAAFGTVAAVGRTYAGDYRFQNLTLRRGGHLEVGDRLSVTDSLSLVEHGLLTHPQTTTEYEAALDLAVGTLDIDATGRIDVTGRGYLGGDRSGLGGGVAHTLGFAPGAQFGTGGSYGGQGGRFVSGGVTNPLYGSATDPQDLGSGGGAYSGAGGDGGGRVFITADTIANDGAISADGALSVGGPSGEGSGGTVNIVVTGDLTGAGQITANGGTTGGGNHVGGGGGRIAIRHGAALGLPLGNIRSLGGDGYYGDGTQGTLHLEQVAP